MKDKKTVKIKTTLILEEEKQRIMDMELEFKKNKLKKIKIICIMSIFGFMVFICILFGKMIKQNFPASLPILILLVIAILFNIMDGIKDYKDFSLNWLKSKFYSRMAILEIKDIINIVDFVQSMDDIWDLYYTVLSDVNKEVAGIYLHNFQTVLCDSEEYVIDLDNFKVFIPYER